MGADEPVLLIEDAQSARDLVERLGRAVRQPLQRRPASQQQRPMLALEIGQDRLALGPSRRRQPFPQEIAVESIMPRVLEQLDLDVGQKILVELEPGLDEGHLVAEQFLALGADAAEVVIEPDGVQPTDAAIVEQGLDPCEVGEGMVGPAALLVQRRRGAGHLGLLVLDDLGLEFQQIGQPMRLEPLQEILRLSRRVLLVGRLLLQVALLPVRRGSITLMHQLERLLQELDLRVADLHLHLANARQLGLQREFGLDDLEPQGIEPRRPLGVDLSLLGQLTRPGRRRAGDDIALRPPGLRRSHPLEQLVSLGSTCIL